MNIPTNFVRIPIREFTAAYEGQKNPRGGVLMNCAVKAMIIRTWDKFDKENPKHTDVSSLFKAKSPAEEKLWKKVCELNDF